MHFKHLNIHKPFHCHYKSIQHQQKWNSAHLCHDLEGFTDFWNDQHFDRKLSLNYILEWMTDYQIWFLKQVNFILRYDSTSVTRKHWEFWRWYTWAHNCANILNQLHFSIASKKMTSTHFLQLVQDLGCWGSSLSREAHLFSFFPSPQSLPVLMGRFQWVLRLANWM